MQANETWQANSSIGNTPTAIKNSVPMETHSSPGIPVQSAYKQYHSTALIRVHNDILTATENRKISIRLISTA